MTKEQYVNPECEKFNISGVDYYVHPKTAPYGASVCAQVASRKSGKILKVLPSIARRVIAYAFIPNPNNYKFTGPKFGGDESVSLDNTEWSSSTHRTVRSVGLYFEESLQPIKLFKSVTDATKYVRETQPYTELFGKWCDLSMLNTLSTKGVLQSSCGSYQLLAAA